MFKFDFMKQFRDFASVAAASGGQLRLVRKRLWHSTRDKLSCNEAVGFSFYNG
jgi:hypothetical protein